ncbi:MAG: LPS assembly protein LptD [Acidobacteria bacterium]|nr:LPS assembly protein LptD [Acidobacteriota bacterium]
MPASNPYDFLRLTVALALGFSLIAPASAQEQVPLPDQEQAAEAQPVEDQAAKATDEESTAETGVPEEPPDPGPPKPAGANEFDFRIEDEAGGGLLSGWAGSIQGPMEGSGEHILSGGFSVRFRDYRAWGEKLFYDDETEQVRAEGPVVLMRGNEVLKGAGLELDLTTETGSIFEAEGNVGTDFFFSSATVHKLSGERFTILDAQFTACEVEDGKVPDWSFRAMKVDVNANGYAKARGATFRAKNAPFIYLPYLLWPVSSSRVSGFLTPKPGFSTRRGPSLGIAYFWAINRSYDATFNVDLYAGAPAGVQNAFSNRPFWGVGTEFRYRPSEGTAGNFTGYMIDDTERGEKRWRMRWNHQSEELLGGFRGVVNFQDVSDFEFFRDFERRVDRYSLRHLYSNAFLTRNWGHHSLNVKLDQRKTFLSADRIIQLRQLPEIEYKLRTTRLGKSPLYLQLNSSLHYFDVNRSVRLQGRYGRANLSPEISVPVVAKTWLSLSLSAGGHVTWYGDSLFNATERRATAPETYFRGEDLLRLVPTAGAEIVGPGFSRIFELGEGGRYSRMKHLIEPRITYGFFEGFDDRVRIPLFDEIDIQRGHNSARISLFNRFLVKPADEESGGAFEILSLELFKDVSFAEPELPHSVTGRVLTVLEDPLGALLRYSPSRRTNVRFDVRYEPRFSEIAWTSLSSSLAITERNSIGVRWALRRNPEEGTTRRHHGQLSLGVDVIPRRLRLSSMVSYDIQRQLLQIQRHILSFQGRCCSVRLEMANYRSTRRQDTQYRMLVTLKSVGSFFDITGGQSETL